MTINKTIYFHIGYHKTGTSAIQSFCVANQEKLERVGVLYAKTGRSGVAHGPLANSLKVSNRILNPDTLYSELKYEVTNTNAKKIIVSSECFLEQIPLERIEPYFKSLNVNVKIIVYVRRQDEWAQSVYNEIIKDPSRRYTGSIFNMREVRIGWLDYNHVISQWAESFGYDNVIVRPFDKKRMSNGLYADFLSIFHVDDISVFDNPITGKATNQGLSEDIIMVLRTLNEIPMTRDMHIEMVDHLVDMSYRSEDKKLGRDYKILSFSEKSKLMESFRVSNKKLFDNFLKNKTSLFCQELVREKSQNDPIQILSVDRQWEIYNALPLHIKEHIERYRPQFADPDQRIPFVHDVNSNEIDRLRQVIQRQRLELNWLYEQRTLASVCKGSAGRLAKYVSKFLNNFSFFR